MNLETQVEITNFVFKNIFGGNCCISPICDQRNRARVDHCQLAQQMTYQLFELHPNLLSSAENIKYMRESTNRATDK